jgi:2,3-bisphosphoglycerate-independent phosphoglycerate mutase
MSDPKVMLIIMDGWGLGQKPSSDAIRHAKTPFVSSLYGKYPNSTLITCGEDVGLPEGQMGNSEVGHLNLGAGRIVYQELQRINVAIRDGSFQKNETLLASIRYAREQQKPLHLIGLVSDGGVHSHVNHFKAIASVCHTEGLSDVFVHAFTDGRDTDPKGGLGYLTDLRKHLEKTTGKIATITGRYYAMDRDKRWERVKLAYDALVHGKGTYVTDPLEAVRTSYENKVTDEFIKPLVVTEGGKPLTTIKDGDAVLFVNFRTDRPRELTQVLTQQDFPEYDMRHLSLHYTTMTEYDKTYRDVHVVFQNDDLRNTLGEILARAGKRQIRIAETEKYPHVTFFFSGTREAEFEGEKRIIVPSPKVATYDLKPEMSAAEVTAAIVPEIEAETADFICLNFANVDMVGHTGIWEAAIKAVETVDQCVEKVVTAALAHDYTVFLTADHGNADYMVNDDGSPNTAHTLNLVPLFLIGANGNATLRSGKLGDIAPSVLTVMGLPIPAEMTGNVLVD